MIIEIYKDGQPHIVEVFCHPVEGHIAYLDNCNEPFMITDDELFQLETKGTIVSV